MRRRQPPSIWRTLRRSGIAEGPQTFLAAGLGALISGVMLFSAASELPRALASSHWPVADGVIIDTKVHTIAPSGRSRGSSYRASLAYTYEVPGLTTFTADRLSWSGMEITVPLREIAQWKLRRYPVGKHVPVYYNPEMPSEAVLEPGLRPMYVAMSMLFLIIFIVCIGYLARSWWRGRVTDDSVSIFHRPE